MGSCPLGPVEAGGAGTGSNRAIATPVAGTGPAGRTTLGGSIGGDAAAVVSPRTGSPLGSKYSMAHAADPSRASAISAGPFGDANRVARWPAETRRSVIRLARERGGIGGSASFCAGASPCHSHKPGSWRSFSGDGGSEAVMALSAPPIMPRIDGNVGGQQRGNFGFSVRSSGFAKIGPQDYWSCSPENHKRSQRVPQRMPAGPELSCPVSVPPGYPATTRLSHQWGEPEGTGGIIMSDPADQPLMSHSTGPPH
jgi:hypothetical protein